jgi:CPA1 family monovalent cation:H+ antiporter
MVSLAAALALPLTLGDGSAMPFRSEILIITVIVILVTLVLQGLTLPPLIKALHLKDDGTDLREEREALLHASEAAVKRLTEIDSTSIIHPQLLERVRLPYEQRLERLTEQTREDPECRLTEGEGAAFRKLRGEALSAERKAIVELRNQGRISEEVLHKVQEALDLEALQPDR